MELGSKINHLTESKKVNNIFDGDYASTIYPILKNEQYGGTEAGEYLEKVLTKLGIHHGKLLDVCCGEFTDGLYLVNKGYNVDGLDGSENFIQISRKKAPFSAFIRTNVEENWAKDLSYYDMVYMMASWFLINNPIKLVENVYKTLSPNGYFVFDFSNKDAFSEGISNKYEEFSAFKREVRVEIKNDLRVANYKYNFDGTESPVLVEHVTKLYSLWDIIESLGCGFKVVNTFSGLTFNEVNWKEDKFVTIIARKG